MDRVQGTLPQTQDLAGYTVSSAGQNYTYTRIYSVCTVFLAGEVPYIRAYTVYIYVGLARTLYIWCIYGVFGRETTKYTVIYGVYIRFWPALHIYTPYMAIVRLRLLSNYFCEGTIGDTHGPASSHTSLW